MYVFSHRNGVSSWNKEPTGQSDPESTRCTDGVVFHTQLGMSIEGANGVEKFCRWCSGPARHRAIWALVIETPFVCTLTLVSKMQQGWHYEDEFSAVSACGLTWLCRRIPNVSQNTCATPQEQGVCKSPSQKLLCFTWEPIVLRQGAM